MIARPVFFSGLGLVRIAAAAAALAFLASTARADKDNWFAVVEIENAVKDVTVHYKVRWGTGNWGKEVALEPSKLWNHWYNYEFANQNRSPTPQITFSTGINRKRTVQTYDLKAYASPRSTEGAKLYRFEKWTDNEGEDYIELVEVPETARKHDDKIAAASGKVVAPGVTRYQQGVKSLEEKRYAEAITAFTEVLAGAPDSFDAHLMRAKAYRATREYAKCLDDVASAIRLNGKSGDAFNLRGLVYEDQKDLEKAFEAYSAAISAQKEFAVAYANRAMIHIAMGRYPEAIADAKQGLQHNPLPRPRASMYNSIGLGHFYQGQYDAAIDAYSEAIEADAAFGPAHSNHAAARYRMGDFAAAVRDATEAIRLAPENAHAYRWLSQAEGRQGLIEAARRDYQKAIALDPTQKDRFEYVGFLADRREALEALAAFKLGSTLSPETLRTLNYLKGVEPTAEMKAEMSANARELVASEARRYDALQLEMVAAADRLLKAARLSPEERAARGWKFHWMYGPVTAPNTRAVSRDGLAGLRIIARLDLPDGCRIFAIFALKYVPPANPDSDEKGRIALLSEPDCLRLEVQFFDRDEPLADYGHQSFSIVGEGTRMTMQPGYYVDRRSGRLLNKDVAVQGLGTSCISCHSNGPRLLVEEMPLFEHVRESVRGIVAFTDQLKHWGASASYRQEVAKIMEERGPAGLLPIEDLYRANQEHWIGLYPRYRDRLKELRPLVVRRVRRYD